MKKNTNKKIIIFDFMRTLYDPDIKRLIPGVIEILNYLRNQNSTMYLISRNEGQRMKTIKDLHIQKYFKEIIFVEKKNDRHFSVEERNTGKEIFVVGDILSEEISIGNRLGYRTIWFKNGKFMGQQPANTEQIPNHIIKNLQELQQLL